MSMRRMTLMIDDELWLALEQLARRRGLTKSEALRRAIADFVAKEGHRKPALPAFAGCGASGYDGSLGEDAERLLRRGAERT